ncbi:MAG TPA: hypothetical protein IAC04_03405 [Candidatus Coprenecus stercoravium]|uniref:Uncharacterized protein n=1 Tax=Candidatus Coprenecus stercoravium TaxID=2840735 RepID=A0A9D2GNQ9_9BACT|nr:hypothetical protein [Candidatus Coprenecus stercoravium]
MNLRVIKKDVNYLIDEFLSDAFISMSFTDDKEKTEQIVGLANGALDLRDETLMKINHPQGDKRAYYRNLTDELLSSLDVMYDKLSAAVSKKAE